MAEKSEKKQRGRPFPKGVSGNPAGKPAGARHRATMLAQEMIDGRGPELVKTALDLAAGGDTTMLKLCLDRLVPPRKDSPVRVELPVMESAADIPQAMGAILASVAAGELTPTEAQAVAGLVEIHRKSLETADLSARLDAIESKLGRS